LTTAMSFLVRHAPADPRDGSLTYNEEQTMEGSNEATARVLYNAIRKHCADYDTVEIGTALSAILVDFAQWLGMPKEDLLEIISNIWDDDETSDEAIH
jgi:hypothetical protein